MKKNIIDKIWNKHLVCHEKGAPDVLFIDLQLLHEVTSPQAFSVLKARNLPFLMPNRNFATVDHSIPTDYKRENWIDEKAYKQVETLRQNCRDFGIQIFDAGSGKQGIVHVISPELGLTQPGMTIVCGDSHTSTHGAFGALAFGIGTTQISNVMATQALLLDRPKTMKVEFVGQPTNNFSAKDAILALIQQVGIQGGTGHAMEFCGEFIRNLSMEGRMTICNMAIECGAKSGLISPDDKTFDYLRGKEFAPKDFEKAVMQWKELISDENATYDAEVIIDLTGKKPFVTWGTNPEQSIQINESIPLLESFVDPAKKLAAQTALEYTKLKAGAPIIGTKIDFVFIGSCTNSRIEDFRIAAQIMTGKQCAKEVKVLIVPGSEKIEEQMKKEGLSAIFEKSGAELRAPGCSMCLAMNGDIVPEGARCASTSNRNFVGRQGAGSYTHLMSPRMAAICAIKGEIAEEL